MSDRIVTHILKKSDIVSRPLPSILLKGEPIVNTADGVMYFSGFSQSIPQWVPAGTGTTANFFEVGSNLYDLQLRHRLTKYDGVSGAGLDGKILSGTTNGFVLADASSIITTDTYVTGGTYSNGTATFTNNYNGTFNVSGFKTSDIYVTGGTYSSGTAVFTNNTGGTFNVTGLSTGTTGLVTGGTYNVGTGIATFTNNTGGTFSVIGFKTSDLVVTGGTYSAGIATFTNNTGGTFNVSGFLSADTYTTGFTYSPTTNQITLAQNQGQPNQIVNINTVSGLTITDLGANRVVYTNGSNKLTSTALATFDGTNMSLPPTGSLSVGTGGLVIGNGGSASIAGTGDLTVNGSLIVFGPSISAFTSQLYIEDNNIILNYNPTGDTSSSSLGAGFTIQDGDGVGNDMDIEIRAMNTFTGLTSTQIPSITEYSGSTGRANRAWVTQLNDIVIRSTNQAIPNGIRVLGEFDVLDGGTF
jgi:hypothetical protein